MKIEEILKKLDEQEKLLIALDAKVALLEEDVDALFERIENPIEFTPDFPLDPSED